MRDKLIPEEKIMAIQEQLSGFIVEQVLDPKGEFYYDGQSHIDNRSKYDNIHVYIIKNEYTYVNIYVCMYYISIYEYVCIIYLSPPIIYMCIYICLYMETI